MNSTQTRQARSPRQIANKAYTLATKKINFDDRRKKPHYHLRERLMIQHTMKKAKRVLNPEESFSMRMLAHPADDFQTPIMGAERAQHYPPPSAPQPQPSEISSSIEQDDLLITIPTPMQKSFPLLVSPSFQLSYSILHYIQWSFTSLFSHFAPSFFWSSFFFSSSANPSGKRGPFTFFSRIFQTPISRYNTFG
ncbi:hypothetical protein BC941DRAFT_421142 [Chlamydoabsidia padenii]|nr:hypothetical protein BC941DRAFT_421142 [Chlamydoabsidia padenii]